MPSWVKDIRDGFKMINARAESVAEKPAFKDRFGISDVWLSLMVFMNG